jgi:hypothetical protein
LQVLHKLFNKSPIVSTTGSIFDGMLPLVSFLGSVQGDGILITGFKGFGLGRFSSERSMFGLGNEDFRDPIS